jgi:hypothetical protein
MASMTTMMTLKLDDKAAAAVAAMANVFVGDADGATELEARVDTRISQNVFVQVVANLRADATLKPTTAEQLDVLTGGRRFEYVGADSIRAYLCKGGGEGALATRAIIKKGVHAPVALAEYGVRINLKSEVVIADGPRAAPSNAHPRYRLKRRFSFEHATEGVRYDCTAVQQVDNVPMTELLSAPVAFEIEVEAVDRVREASAVSAALLKAMYRVLVLMTDGTLVCTRSEKHAILKAYDGVMGKGNGTSLTGPQPVTLEMRNLAPPRPGVVSIWEDYTVTDKADGERAQLFVHNGTAYLIDNLRNVRVAALVVPDPLNGSVLDGELISATRAGVPTHVFAAFDAYRHGPADVTKLPLVAASGKTRLSHARAVVNALGACKLLDTLELLVKDFALVSGDAIAAIVGKAATAPYAVDGLIFTPASAPVGGRYPGDEPSLRGRWMGVMKWKPPSQNSVDFKVMFKRHPASGQDIVTTRVPPGESRETVQYKSLDLFVGYRPADWEPVDPVAALTQGAAALPPANVYVSKLFDPDGSGASTVQLRADDKGRVFTALGEPIEHDTIVEFSFESGEGWCPMRNRVDKTERMAASGGRQMTANSMETALGVWRSIRNPVTLAILKGDDPVPVAEEEAASDAYFVTDLGRNDAAIKSMNDYHNLAVKAPLFAKYAVKNGALFEFACGRGGDMNRWAAGGFALVAGCDVSLDNLVNPQGGIYQRMLTSRTKLPPMVFIQMDCTARMHPPLDDIRAAAAASPHYELFAALWNLDKVVPPALERFRGAMAKGFDLTSCQFAVHYMFESDDTLDRFIGNVAYATRLGGHFIGTTFDGETVERELRKQGGEMTGRIGNLVAWNVRREFEGKYQRGTGQAVEVFVETIGKPMREYLVHFDTLAQRLKSAGFELVETEMFGDTAKRLAKDPELKGLVEAMNPVVRRFSSFSRWFAFKRVR